MGRQIEPLEAVAGTIEGAYAVISGAILSVEATFVDAEKQVGIWGIVSQYTAMFQISRASCPFERNYNSA